MTKLRIAVSLCALALLWPATMAAEPDVRAPIAIEAGPTCGEVNESILGRIPVQIVISEKALAQHQQDEYVVLRNDGSTYEEPVFVDTGEVVARPPLR